MDVKLDSAREPTHLGGLYDNGIIEISNNCSIPISVVPSIIEASKQTPPHIDNSDLTVLSSQSIYSKSDDNACDMCGEELDMDMLLDNPDVAGDPEHISLVIITESGPSGSTPLIVHKECLEELGTQLQEILNNNPELMAAVGI